MTEAIFGEPEVRAPGNALLTDRFVVPPFSVLDTRQGYWQERRRAWLALGIESELGRGAVQTGDDGVPRTSSAPGGSLMMAATKVDGKLVRGDSRGRPIGAGANDMSPQLIAATSGMSNHPAHKTLGALPVTGSAGKANIEASERAAGLRRSAFHGTSSNPDDPIDKFGMAHQRSRNPDHLGLAALADPAYEYGEQRAAAPGTSIFDPVLCELVYRWFMPEGGTVLDPFAGGSVRGIVAAMLGHAYTGVDLSAQQVAANSKQAQRILTDEPKPEWLVGDSRRLLPVLPGAYDLVFTCPPYYDLEVYSDDPADLSHMSNYVEFISAYRDVIEAAAHRLRADRFMVLVVSEIRDKQGFCRGLVPDTINLVRGAGLQLYNEAVLVNSAGTLPLRVGQYMEAGRKLGRCHQNVLVFAKGDPGRGWSYERPAPPAPQLALVFGDDE